MMTGSFILTAIWTARTTSAFVASSPYLTRATRLLSSASSSVSVEACLSRLGTLQTLLSKHGAPGSAGCSKPNDLVAIDNDSPELISVLSGGDDELANLHPYLFPICQSKSTGNVICGYRNPFVEESAKGHPWPIVETRIGAPGMELLSLNSEHLMRRIACEYDFSEDVDATDNLVDIYNEGLGKGLVKDASLDAPYQVGSVAQLGYGADKYVLLRVGPFPDLYQSMARNHATIRNDEQSALIAAETASTKLAGFGSNFRYYAKLLSSFDNRQEEARDAARMCLRLPLPTMGMSQEDFREVAVLGQIADESDSIPVALEKMKAMYDKIREVEREDDTGQTGKTLDQMALDEANHLIDETALSGKDWSSIRGELAERFRAVHREDMASFIER